MITWTPYTPRTTYGYTPRQSCTGEGATIAAAVVLELTNGYAWALVHAKAQGVETTREEAERKAGEAYRHAAGLLGGVRT